MPPLYLLLLILFSVILVTIIQLEIISIAFQKLGLSPRSALLLMLGALFGSGINIPVIKVASTYVTPLTTAVPRPGGLWQFLASPRTGYTIIAVNLGGCIIPLGISLYLLARQLVNPFDLLLAMLVVSAACYVFSRPLPGVGIGMPVLVAPLVTVMSAIILEPANAAPLAFSSGVLGVLLGADLLRLPDIRKMGVGIASIGGAGTFDGVFLTGIIAVLLA